MALFNRHSPFAALALLLAASDILGHASAATYVVGDGIGWTVPRSPADYANWASSHTFRLGDVLVFNFPTGIHDVVRVAKADYDSCSANNPIGRLITVGPANLTLNSTGPNFFICTFPQHCSLGQKLAINVSGASTTPTPGAPPGTPTPTPAPTSPPRSGTPPPAATPTPAPPSPPTSPTPSPTPTPTPAPPSPSPSITQPPTPSPTSSPPSPSQAPAPTPTGTGAPSPASEAPSPLSQAPGANPGPPAPPGSEPSTPPSPSSGRIMTAGSSITVIMLVLYSLVI